MDAPMPVALFEAFLSAVFRLAVGFFAAFPACAFLETAFPPGARFADAFLFAADSFAAGFFSADLLADFRAEAPLAVDLLAAFLRLGFLAVFRVAFPVVLRAVLRAVFLRALKAGPPGDRAETARRLRGADGPDPSSPGVAR